MFAFYFALVFAYPAGMGFGDVKLAGVLGALMGYLSWSALIVATFGAFLLGAIVGVALIVTSRGGRKTAIPFGPFMIAFALITVYLQTTQINVTNSATLTRDAVKASSSLGPQGFSTLISAPRVE